jgi:hypothetical protein
MATQRRYRRFVGTALVGGPLLVAGVVWASPAHADQTSYLNDLHKDGIHAVEGGDAELVNVGMNLCNEVWYGHSRRRIAATMLQGSDTTLGTKGLTPKQATDLVNYAVADLCPNYANFQYLPY